MRRVVGQVGGRRAGARAEDEAEAGVVADVVDQLHQLVEILFRLAGKADDEVAAHADAGPHRAQLAHDALVFHGGVAALHGHQDAVGAVLHRQMQMAHQLRHLAVHLDQARRELVGVAGGVADALDAGDLGHVFDQQGEVGDLGRVAHRPPVGVHVLAQQGDFLHALVGQASHFGQHVVERAAELLAARVGHHAVAAVFGAAFHDRDEGAGAFHPRRRQVVELLDLRKADVHLRGFLALALGQQLGQAVQRLRAEHHVHEGRAADDFLALLAGHAAAHADQHTLLLQVPDAAEVGKHLFLRLLAHRAGVEEDQVGLLRVVGWLVAFGGVHDVGHLVRVVLVHLAAKGLDENFAGHGGPPGMRCGGAGRQRAGRRWAGWRRRWCGAPGRQPP